MSTIIAFIYPDKSIPPKIYEELVLLERQHHHFDLIDLREVEIKDNGKIKFSNDNYRPFFSEATDNFLPALVGLLFFQPPHFQGGKVEEILRILSLSEVFVRALRRDVFCGCSLLFLHVREEGAFLVEELLSDHGGLVVETDISGWQYELLRRIFHGEWPISPEVSSSL